MKFFSSQGFWEQTGLSLIRILVGIFMIYHGWEVFIDDKMVGYQQWLGDLKFPAPSIMAYLGKGSEFVGGIMLAFGFLTRLAVIPLTVTMAIICFGVGHGKIFMDDQHPFLFILLFLVFFFYGPGWFSVDRMIFKRRQPALVIT
jgi:uncharacterized membrane protein YphA (DoxX/SURF4 family)